MTSLLLDLFQTNETRAENLTCGSVGEDSGDPEQKLILKWHPDSEMVFFFRKKNEFNILHHVVLRMLIPLGTIHILRNHIFRIFGPPPPTSDYVIYEWSLKVLACVEPRDAIC